ncbi:MAG TPA: MotA/TolQ/ExbB proton channel family protein [Nevskia sp.]|nr:MotA/TolQ/ExbB proton channel family protein [Nevskia sp.]
MTASFVDALAAGFAAPFESVADFFQLGGWVLKWILLAALAMWTLILERYWYFWRIHPAELRGRLGQWLARGERRSWHAHRIREQLISELKVGMSVTLPLIRVMVPLAPLLGLLGTVTGMLEVFDAMTAAGQSDVRAMAYGVSHAMISTLAGLVVSLLGLFFSVQLSSRVRHESERLPDLLLPE